MGEESEGRSIKTVNLKSDMPSVQEALQRLDREMALARQQKQQVVKLVHGYGSTGVGGDIRIAVQRRLHDLAEAGQIRGCIFGENWSKSDDATCATAAGGLRIEDRSRPGSPQSRHHGRADLTPLCGPTSS
jgi:hypothetical protein